MVFKKLHCEGVLNLISRVEPILNNIAGKASNSRICFSKLVQRTQKFYGYLFFRNAKRNLKVNNIRIFPDLKK